MCTFGVFAVRKTHHFPENSLSGYQKWLNFQFMIQRLSWNPFELIEQRHARSLFWSMVYKRRDTEFAQVRARWRGERDKGVIRIRRGGPAGTRGYSSILRSRPARRGSLSHGNARETEMGSSPVIPTNFSTMARARAHCPLYSDLLVLYSLCIWAFSLRSGVLDPFNLIHPRVCFSVIRGLFVVICVIKRSKRMSYLYHW